MTEVIDKVEAFLALAPQMQNQRLAAEMICDLVLRGAGARGGRPRKPATEPVTERVTEPVSKPVSAEPARATAPVDRDPDLRTGEDPDSPADAGPAISAESKPAKADKPAKRPAHPFHRQALADFCAIWSERYHVPYAPSKAECSQLRDVLQVLPEELRPQLADMFRAYLRDEDQFVAKVQRHSMLWFCTKGNGVNKYRAAAAVLAPKPPRQTADAVLDDRDRCSFHRGGSLLLAAEFVDWCRTCKRLERAAARAIKPEGWDLQGGME